MPAGFAEKYGAAGNVRRSWSPGDFLPGEPTRYQLLLRLGGGGFGTVFRAYDRMAEVDVAIKILHPELSSSREAIDALRNGFRKTFEFNQENLIKVLHFDVVEGCAYMVMELLEGKPLDRMMTREFATGMPLEKCWPIIEGAGRGLDYLHRHGVVHSDFKPANVFVTAGGVAKVLDFDLSRAFRDSSGTMVGSGKLLGVTKRYASPEMLQLRAATCRDDVFSFGVLVYELIAGRHPFSDVISDKRPDGLSAMGVAGKQYVVPRIPGLKRRQNEALARALRLDFAERTKSIAEVLQQLEPNPRGSASVWPFALGAGLLGTAATLAAVYYTLPLSQRNAVPREPERSVVTAPAEGRAAVSAPAKNDLPAPAKAEPAPVNASKPEATAAGASPPTTPQRAAPAATAATPPKVAGAVATRETAVRPPAARSAAAGKPATRPANADATAECGFLLTEVSMGSETPAIVARIKELNCRP